MGLLSTQLNRIGFLLSGRKKVIFHLVLAVDGMLLIGSERGVVKVHVNCLDTPDRQNKRNKKKIILHIIRHIIDVI